MLPSKGRREIIVDGTLYHYSVKGYVSVVIRNSETGKITEWHEDWKRKWGCKITPSDIEKVIREKRA